MAFITAGSEYHGKENFETIIRPRFMGTKPAEMGIRIIDTQGASSIKLNFFGKIAKILMPYVTGFQGGTLSPQKQKKLTVSEFKAENEYSKQDYKNMIYEQITNKGGVAQNDITGTDVFKAELEVFFSAVEADVFSVFWLGDTTKRHIQAGTYPDGTAYAAGDVDKYYNVMDGILKQIMDDVYQSYVSHQVRITGWNKTTYPVLYLAESGGTVYAYGSAAHRTGASSGNRLFSFTATNSTYPYNATISELNSSGIAGYIVLEKACTSGTFELYANESDYVKKIDLPASLTTDTAETYMLKMLRNSTPELKALKKAGLLRFYVTDTILFNYEDTIRSGSLDITKQMMIDGIPRIAIDGVPLIPINVDALIEADFASTFPRNIIILTTPDNLALAINGSSSFSETRFWFNPDENSNRQRTQFEMGADYVLPELITIAY